MTLTALIILYAGGLGLIIGSFLNAVIYRLPRRKSFGMSRSACPSCERGIQWYDNIPLVSFLLLRGKCRHCHCAISWRYPFVEALCGAVFAFLAWKVGLTVECGVMALLSSALIAIFFIDIDHLIIPDKITIPGIAVGVAVSFLPGGIGIVESLIGLAVGGGGLLAVALLGDFLFKKESMGGGDIKMAAMLGAFVGWQKILLIFFGSAAIGLVVSLVLMGINQRIRDERIVPFGPFLAVAGFVALVAGDAIIRAYLQHFGGV